MIEVKNIDQRRFSVIVSEGRTNSEHKVTLDDSYYQELTGGLISKEKLIKKSFEFLLERESKESILSQFDLRVISNYFAEYEDEIKNTENSE